MRLTRFNSQSKETRNFTQPLPISRGNLSLEQCENLVKKYREEIAILIKEIQLTKKAIENVVYLDDRPDDDEAFTKWIIELENRLEELHNDLERNTRSLKELTKNSA